ncbi:hypothetical protein LTS15_002723 [Exophiala xenobiotica]|nr:hypothetical protein LTS15_002723 [Exophiala xenobiotica]
MSTIYSQAKKVHVWLGSEGSFAGQAMELIRENADSSDEDIIGTCMQNRSDYWRRAWTLQEFVLPRRGVLMANEGWTDFEAFRRLIDRTRAMMRRSRDPSLLSWCSEISIFGGQDFWVMREKSTDDRPMNLFSHGTHDGSTGWLRPRACSDVRDMIFANIAFTKYGSSFKVDYSLNPLDLLLESLWLEHDQDTMAEQMALSARLLSIIPMSIMLYSDTRRQRLRDPCSGKTVDVPADVDLLHLRSASSDLNSKRWLSVADPHGAVWSTLSHPCDWKVRELTQPSGLDFPRKAHTPFALLFGLSVILAIAVSFPDNGPIEPQLTFPPDRDPVVDNDDLTDDAFLDQRPKCCRVLGIYNATCTPTPMRVYYALLENPDSIPEYDIGRVSSRTLLEISSPRGLDRDKHDLDSYQESDT